MGKYRIEITLSDGRVGMTLPDGEVEMTLPDWQVLGSNDNAKL